MARGAGVRSPIDPVLSMPLGSSDITLLEAAQLYGAMLTGRTHRFHPDALATDATLQAVAREHETVKLEPYDARRAEAFPEVGLIRSIAMRDGRVLYSAARSDEEMQERVVGADLAAMLRTTVAHGTGRRAEGKVRPGATDPERVARLQSSDARTPLLGKTGTTNSYKNSAFGGAVPGLAPGGDTLTWEHPVVIAHPETGAPTLFVNLNSTTRIVGMSERESDVLLGFLFEHVKSPEIQVRVKWDTRTLVFLDNRCTQHYAVPDYDERRVLHRVAIEGTEPVAAGARS